MERVTSLSGALVTSLVVLSLVITGYVTGLPIYSPGPARVFNRNRTVITRDNAVDVKALSGKSWNLNECPPGIQITVGKKMLNKKSFYCTRSDAMKLAPLLIGENLRDRVYVWCRTASLYNSLVTEHKVFDVTSLNLFEDDIILTREDVDSTLAAFFPTPNLRQMAHDAARDYQRRNSRRRPKRKARTNRSRLWNNAVVPYSITESGFGGVDRQVIVEAIAQWEKNTCIRFAEQQAQLFQPHIVFRNGAGCASNVGRQPRGQHIILGTGCSVVGIAAHEIGHALGFFHEHTRPDRDRYVTIVQKNIRRHREQFAKLHWDNAKTYGVAYDYSSVMHYESTTFSNGKERVILTTDPEMQKVIGQRERLSFLDIKLANAVYCSNSCGGRSLEWSECKHGGYRNPNYCSSCVCPRGLAPPRCEGPAPGENADCDRQMLEASGSRKSLSSPGYHGDGFPAGGFCSWLIKTSSPGKQIKLQFTGKFNFNDDVDLCTDYVEIRYKGLSRPGPRFCGTEKPTKMFISHGEEMLITIHAEKFSRGQQGFQVEYVEEYCGGCSADAGADEPLCSRVVRFKCSPSNEESFCYREETFCCDSHHQEGDRCIVGSRLEPSINIVRPGIVTQPPTTTTTTTTTTTPATTTTLARTTTAVRDRFRLFTPPPRRPQTEIPRTGWTAWGPWTGCSATCGLCGTRYRMRTCTGGFCYGSPVDVRKCGNAVCPFETFTKSTTCRRRARHGCQWWDFSCYESYTCYKLSTKPRCCVGTPVDGICRR